MPTDEIPRDKRAATLDRGFEERIDFVALALIAVLAAISVRYACSTIFNPDEAEKILMGLGPSWSAALEGSRKVSHPPLAVLLVHAQAWLGTAEGWLRLPSLIAMPVAGWFFFRWLRALAGTSAAVAGLTFFVCSPIALWAGTEVREYGMLLAFTALALWSVERMLERGNFAWLAVHAVALAGGFLDHYSTAWIALALGLYVIAEMWRRSAPLSLWLAWGGAQLMLMGIAAWTFFVHGTAFTAQVAVGETPFFWVAHGFRESETVWSFVTTRFVEVFARFAGGPIAGWVATGLFAIGVGKVLLGDSSGRPRRSVVLLWLVPLVLGVVLGLLRLYPFAGMRQSTYLLPGIAAAIGVGVATLARERLVAIVALAAVLTPLAVWTARPANNPEVMGPRHLAATFSALDELWTPERRLFTETGGDWQLRFYWRGRQELTRVRRLTPQSWGLAPQKVMSYARTSAAAVGLQGEPEVCLLASGQKRPTAPLDAYVPPDQLLAYRESGVFQLVCVKLAAGWRRLLP